jgi:tetratricopeptide (TPR) repeat protein
LLGPDEHRALCALSVFRGGWTREAAWSVAGVGVSPMLVLIDASWVRRAPSGRYTWHPLVHQYVQERAKALRRADHLAEVEERHAHWYLGRLTRGEAPVRDAAGLLSVDNVEAELANLVAAWRWGLAHQREDVLTGALTGLGVVCDTSGRIRLLIALLYETLAVARAGGLLQGRTLICLGSRLADHDATWPCPSEIDPEGLTMLERGLEVVEALGDERHVGVALVCIARVHVRAGRLDEALAAYQGAERRYRAAGDGERIGQLLLERANVASTFDEALQLARSAVAHLSPDVAPAAKASTSFVRGRLLFLRSGASDEVLEAHETAVAVFDELGSVITARWARMRYVEVLLAKGALAEARETLCAARAGVEDLASDDAARLAANGRSLSAWLAYLAGHAAAADRHAREVIADAPASEPGMAWSIVLARTVLAHVALERRDVPVATAELRSARDALEYAAPLEDGVPPRSAVLEWVRLLACEAELALARSRPQDARIAVRKALSIARRSAQDPAGTVALVAAARLLGAGGDVVRARNLAAALRHRPGAPFEVRRALRRLDARWRGARGGSGAFAPVAEPVAHHAAVADMIERAGRAIGGGIDAGEQRTG